MVSQDSLLTSTESSPANSTSMTYTLFDWNTSHTTHQRTLIGSECRELASEIMVSQDSLLTSTESSPANSTSMTYTLFDWNTSHTTHQRTLIGSECRELASEIMASHDSLPTSMYDITHGLTGIQNITHYTSQIHIHVCSVVHTTIITTCN